MRQFDIRRLLPADADDYREIRLAALRGDADAFGSTYEAEAARPMSEFAQRLSTSVVFAAYAGGQVIGMAGFKRHEGARNSHKAFVWGTYVRPELRRRGVARGLMQTVLEAAGGLVEQLTLCVVKDNPAAIALYRELGFEIYGIEPRALKGAAGYADEVLMVRFLSGTSTAGR
jgi:ribosomal protein S18 acetylase RimI-like enzyme